MRHLQLDAIEKQISLIIAVESSNTAEQNENKHAAKNHMDMGVVRTEQMLLSSLVAMNQGVGIEGEMQDRGNPGVSASPKQRQYMPSSH